MASGGYPVIVPGQPDVDATPAAEAEIELYQPYSAIGIPGTKSIITIPESGIMNVTFTTNAATIDRTFWIDLTPPGSSGYMMGQVYLTVRVVLPPVPGPGETRITFNEAEQTAPSFLVTGLSGVTLATEILTSSCMISPLILKAKSRLIPHGNTARYFR